MEEYEDDFENETPPTTPGDGLPPPPIAIHDLDEPAGDGYVDRSPTSTPWLHITLEELDVAERLAAGAMGAVHSGYYRGRPVAIKTLHDTSPAALGAVEAELQVHASLRDRRIVELIGANLVPPGCCIVMEQCERSLFEWLHRRPDPMSRRQAVGIALQVAEGMAFLHSRRPPIVHRDLKSHNVLLDFKGDAKLCDFGLVNTREVTAGTPNYMAPELLLAKSHSTPVDVFAFGVLLNELWAREVPWDGYPPLDIKDKVAAGERPPVPRTMPYACESLLRKLWHTTPASRPSFVEVIPAIEAVLDTLPSDRSALGGSLGMDSLDALDSLTSLSMKPRAR
jgi:serine/threonine protein kinase